MSMMTPREITSELDKHIVGQQSAKRAVAIALRNRWRRMQLGENLRNEITPKNILMIGPTGVGKTDWLTPPLSKLKPPSSPKSAMSGATWSRLSETWPMLLSR